MTKLFSAMQIRNYIMAIAILGALNSCSFQYGNKDIMDEAKVDSLVPHVATKVDVYRTFGQPSAVKNISDYSTAWKYRYRLAKVDTMGYIPVMGVNLVAGGKDGAVITRDFYFDQGNVLSKKDKKVDPLHTYNVADLGRMVHAQAVDSDTQNEVKKEMEKLGFSFDTKIAYDSQLLENAVEE